MTATATDSRPAQDGPASLAFHLIPSEPRSWRLADVLAIGEVTVIGGKGGVTMKGLAMAKVAALEVLGLPKPGTPALDPGRVLWVSSGTEDDPIHDLAPRITSALAAAAAEHGTDPEDALGARRLIHNLSEWESGDPIEWPGDEAKIRAEVGKLNQLDDQNRAPGDPAYTQPGPPVTLVIFDPLDAILGPDATVDSRPGARRVMTSFGRFARGAQVAVSVIHHVVSDGHKLAGSPAITNSVRLAFMVTPDKANTDVKVMRPVKSNVSAPGALRWVKSEGPGCPFVRFLGEAAAEAEHVEARPAQDAAGDTLRDRISQAQLRERVREAAAQRDPAPAGEHSGPADPGAWLLVKCVMGPDGQPGPAVRLGRSWPDADRAKHAAAQDARGAALSWRTDDHGREVTSLPDGEGPGRHVVYVASPAARA